MLRGPSLKRIPSGQLADLIEALEESNGPILVQTHDWARLPERSHWEIEREYVVLQEQATNERDIEDGWLTTTIGDCAVLVRQMVAPSAVGDAPYIGLEHIGENTLHLTDNGVASDVASTKAQFQRGDILFGKLRPYFRKVVRAPFDGICSTDIWVVRAQKSVEQGFLYYCMANQPFVEFATSGSEGTRMPRANWEYVSQYEIPLPPLPEQRAIAHILGTLDDKIELNRRMNETLEEMARALFKSWFVDFEPVRAKAALKHPQSTPRGGSDGSVEREGIDAATAQGGRDWTVERARAYLDEMDPSIAALFPDHFVDSELGEVPAGWGVGCFGDIVDQVRDKENPLASPDTVFRHFSIPAFDKDQWPQTEHGENIKSQKSRVPPGVILLSKLNPEIERVWFVDVASDERAICSTEFLVLQARLPFQRSYVYCLARSPLFRQQIESFVTGTSKSHQRAQVGAVLALGATIPSAPVIHAFDQQASALLDRSVDCRRETTSLAALRDTLLPKLVSGEIRVNTRDEESEAIGKHQ